MVPDPDDLGEYRGLTDEQQPSQQNVSYPLPPASSGFKGNGRHSRFRLPSWRPPSKVVLALIMLAFILCEFLRGLDAGALPAILTEVAVDLKASSTDTYWSGSAYQFATTATQPVLGGFAMAVGRRLCITVCISMFIIGSVLTATSQSIMWMILARVVQGIGAGGMDIMFAMVITEMVPLSKLANYSSMLQLAAGAGVVWGQLIGAVIVERVSWRYVFWINVPIAGVPLVMLPMLIKPREAAPRGTLRAQLKSMDWIGVVVVTGSLVTLLYALFSGGVVAPWHSGRILAPLIIGMLGFCAFVLHEKYWADRYCTAGPLIPLRLFNNRTALTGYIIVLLHGLVVSAIIFNMTLYLFMVGNIDLIGLAVRSLPTAIIPLGSAGVASFLITKVGSFKWFNIIGLSVLAIGLGVLSTLKATSPLRDQVGFQIIYSIGLGILFPGRSMAAIVSQERDTDHPQAQAVISIGFNLGQTFGLAVGSAVLQNTWNTLVTKGVADGSIPAHQAIPGSEVQKSFEVVKLLPDALRDKYREIAASSTRSVWLVMLGLTGATLVLALFMKNLRFGIGLPRSEKLDQASSDSDEERLIASDTLAMSDIGPKESGKEIQLYIARW